MLYQIKTKGGDILKIGCRIGHSPNCQGMDEFVNEYDWNKQLFPLLVKELEFNGHIVINCNSNAKTESAELNEGTNICNANKCDMYVTLHTNAYKVTDKPMGVEAHAFNPNSTDTRIVNEIAKLGLTNRGVKQSSGLHDLVATNKGCHAVIVESFFGDSKKDVSIANAVGHKAFAKAIAKGICGDTYKSSNDSKNVKYIIQLGAYHEYEDAKADCEGLKKKGIDCFVKEV